MAAKQSAKQVTVTPQMSQAYLNRAAEIQEQMKERGEKGLQNRPLKVSIVDKYGTDMAAGNWVPNGETISISVDGDPLNGQHRFTASVKYNVSFTTWMVFDVPREAFTTFDQNAPRTAAQVLAIMGERDSPILSGALARVIQYEQGTLGLSSPPIVTTVQKLEALESHPEIVKYAKKASSFPFQKVAVASTWAIFARKYPTKTNEFFDQLKSGVTGSRTPAYRLREKLIMRPKGTRLRQEIVMNLFFVALNAHVSGSAPGQLRLAKGPLAVN